VTERRLASDLVARFSRLTWITLSAYAVVVIGAFAVLGEVSLGRSMGQTATVIESLLGLYAGPGGERTTVASDSLAEHLVGMGARFIITRTHRPRRAGGPYTSCPPQCRPSVSKRSGPTRLRRT